MGWAVLGCIRGYDGLGRTRLYSWLRWALVTVTAGFGAHTLYTASPLHTLGNRVSSLFPSQPFGLPVAYWFVCYCITRFRYTTRQQPRDANQLLSAVLMAALSVVVFFSERPTIQFSIGPSITYLSNCVCLLGWSLSFSHRFDDIVAVFSFCFDGPSHSEGRWPSLPAVFAAPVVHPGPLLFFSQS